MSQMASNTALERFDLPCWRPGPAAVIRYNFWLKVSPA